MPTPPVVEKVRALQAELAEAQPDPAIAAELTELREHVEMVLTEPTKPERYASLGERLRQAYLGFHVEHPKLAAAMDNLIAELTAAGL